MADVPSILGERFRAAIAAAFGPGYAAADPLIRVSANARFGDYQANFAMGLAKLLGAKPRDVAQAVVDKLDLSEVCAKVELAGPGFVNLHLRDDFLARQAAAMAGDARLGVPAAQPPRTVVVDYSCPNVAKEMHVGHLRSTVIGDCIARVLGFLGHQVIRQNHLGDWGTQFGMLIEHLRDTGWDATADHSIRDLNALYQEAKKHFDADPAFAARARQRVVALQAGDTDTQRVWRQLIEESQRHFNETYRALGVLLTDADVRGESFYNPHLAQVVAELEKAGVARVDEGAVCVFPPGFLGPEGKPAPLIIRKSDGGYGYATTDLAALRYRVRDLKAQRIIYVTDARQRQHFAMVFKTAEQAGWLDGPAGRAVPEHVPFGTVLGDDGKPFKTRAGDTVKLADLLAEAVERALATVSQKNPDLPEEQRRAVAQAVGIGAVKYADLANDRIKDYVFNWERMLAFDGNTAPYLQYSYVRIRSIFRRGRAEGLAPAGVEQAPIAIAQPAERALVLKLQQLPAAVDGVAVSLEPHRLGNYLYELASAYHQFFESCPVLKAPDESARHSRLALCDLVARTLRTGLELLGIQVVEQM